MILLINANVKDREITFRYGLPPHNPYDIFRYSLASLKPLSSQWSKIIICCTLADHYEGYWPFLQEYIGSLFPNAAVYQNSLADQKEWEALFRSEVERYSDRLVWVQDSGDHIFLDYTLDLLDAIVQDMYLNERKRLACIYSYWPEQLRFAARRGVKQGRFGAHYAGRQRLGTYIVTKALLRDWVHGERVAYDCCVPYRELSRRFDGYARTINIAGLCPPLTIPTGFFDREMCIRYCGLARKEGWVHMNPRLRLCTVQPKGADCHYSLEDMPLFWRDHLQEVHVVQEVAHDILHGARYKQRLAVYDPAFKLKGPEDPRVVPAKWAKEWLRINACSAR